MDLTKENLLALKKILLESEDKYEIEKYLPEKSAYQFLVECSKDRMNNCAINYLGRKISFKSLINKIDLVAKSFDQLGIKQGDTVAIAMLTVPESIISFYALNKIGATAFMINATHDKPLIKEDLEDSKAKVLIANSIFYDDELKNITDQLSFNKVIVSSLGESLPYGFVGDVLKMKLVEHVKDNSKTIKSDSKCISWNDMITIGKKSKKNVEPFYEKNYGAVIASTSGSTGKAKRPLMTNENLNAIPIQMGMTCDVFRPGDSILTTLPPWILYSLFNSIHEPLCLGVTLDLDPLFDSKKVSKRIRQYKFNHWNTIPGYVEDFVNDKRANGIDCSHIKSITTGGEYRSSKLKQEAEAKLNANNSYIEVGQGYGASECGGCFCYSYEKGMPADTIGKPLFGNRYKIVDQETGKELGPNSTGILYLYSPTVMKCYYNDEEQTQKALIKDEFGKIWYKTDDTAHFDEKGQLFMDGRIRRIELSKDNSGQPVKVFPDKLKKIVLMHSSIEKCEIVMIPDKDRISIPVAFLVMKEGQFFTKETISEINDICVANNVESYMMPEDYKIVSSIPKTKSLKVDYNKLKEEYLAEKTCSNGISLKKVRN